MIHKRKQFGITYSSDLNEVFVFGGEDEGPMDNCEKYSIDRDEWTELEAMKEEKYGVSACILNN